MPPATSGRAAPSLNGDVAPSSTRRPRPQVRLAREIVSATPGTAIPVPASKGTNILHVRAYVAERFAEGAWDELLGTFDAEDEATLRAAVPVGWYPVVLDIGLLRRADEVFGRGDLALVNDVGSFSARMDLTGIQRMFLRALTPAGILTKSGEYWCRFQNTGRWSVQSVSPTRGSSSLRGWGVADEGACAFLCGYIVGMFRASGSAAKRFEHEICRCRGADACVFAGEWG